MRRGWQWIVGGVIVVLAALLAFSRRKDDGYDFLRKLNPQEFYREDPSVGPGGPPEHVFRFFGDPVAVGEALNQNWPESRRILSPDNIPYKVRIGVTGLTEFLRPNGSLATFEIENPADEKGTCEVTIDLEPQQPWLQRQLIALRRLFHLP